MLVLSGESAHPARMKGIKHVVTLSPKEKHELSEYARKRTAQSDLAERAKIILMAGSGENYDRIAKQLGIGRRAVTKWTERWNETAACDVGRAVDRLRDLQRSGRHDKFAAEQKARIIALACEKPADYGRPITHWTNRELAEEAARQGIVESISPRQVGRILKKRPTAA